MWSLRAPPRSSHKFPTWCESSRPRKRHRPRPCGPGCSCGRCTPWERDSLRRVCPHLGPSLVEWPTSLSNGSAWSVLHHPCSQPLEGTLCMPSFAFPPESHRGTVLPTRIFPTVDFRTRCCRCWAFYQNRKIHTSHVLCFFETFHFRRVCKLPRRRHAFRPHKASTTIARWRLGRSHNFCTPVVLCCFEIFHFRSSYKFPRRRHAFRPHKASTTIARSRLGRCRMQYSFLGPSNFDTGHRHTLYKIPGECYLHGSQLRSRDIQNCRCQVSSCQRHTSRSFLRPAPPTSILSDTSCKSLRTCRRDTKNTSSFLFRLSARPHMTRTALRACYWR